MRALHRIVRDRFIGLENISEYNKKKLIIENFLEIV